MRLRAMAAAGLFAAVATGTAAHASCAGLPSPATVESALGAAVTTVHTAGASLGNNMWATIVDAHGVVCSVVNTGGGGKASLEEIWLGSRVISAQKANTANAFSLSAGSQGTPIALSTANLYTAVQPGGSLYGLQASNPVDTSIAYAGPPALFGTGKTDPMVGGKVGGVNVFGGGLAIYNSSGVRLGAIGVSGDTSCADHFVAWLTRNKLGLDYVPGGISKAGDDDIIFDITPATGLMSGISAGGFGHPHCLFPTEETTVLGTLPPVSKITG